MPRLVLFFLCGGIFLSLCDQIHVHTGVLFYDGPGLAGQAWWVPLEFGVASLAIYAIAWPVTSRLREPSNGALASALAWFFAAYVASGVFRGHPLALSAGYGLTWLARLAGRGDDAFRVATSSLVLAVAGVVVEGAVSATGAFRYANPDYLLVPMWLPGLYLHGAPLALAVVRRLRAPAGERPLAPA